MSSNFNSKKHIPQNKTKKKNTIPKATVFPPYTSNFPGFYPQLLLRFISTGVKIKGSVIVVISIISSLLYNQTRVQQTKTVFSQGRASQLKIQLRTFYFQKNYVGGAGIYTFWAHTIIFNALLSPRK